jgi:hypothetical protein
MSYSGSAISECLIPEVPFQNAIIPEVPFQNAIIPEVPFQNAIIPKVAILISTMSITFQG